MGQALAIVVLVVASLGFWNGWAEEETMFNPLTASPANTMLAFVIGEWQKADTHVANADRTVSQLSENSVRDSSPDWSPDGARIVFRSRRAGNWEVCAMDVDVIKRTRLTSDRGRQG